MLSLSNLVNSVTCATSQNGTSMNVMIENMPRSFHNTTLIETGLNNCHKMILSVLELSLRDF